MSSAANRIFGNFLASNDFSALAHDALLRAGQRRHPALALQHLQRVDVDLQLHRAGAFPRQSTVACQDCIAMVSRWPILAAAARRHR